MLEKLAREIVEADLAEKITSDLLQQTQNHHHHHQQQKQKPKLKQGIYRIPSVALEITGG